MKAIQLLISVSPYQPCSVIKKAEKLLSGPNCSATKQAFGLMRDNAEDRSKISRVQRTMDLHILDWIKPLKILLTVGHLEPCVVKIQKSTLKLCFYLFIYLWCLDLTCQANTLQLSSINRAEKLVFSFINGK